MTDIVSLTEVKTWLNISGTEYDAVLDIIRKSVNQSILNYTEASFDLVGPIQEILDGNRSDQIVTREYPINSVSSVKFGVKADGTGGTLVDASSYQVLPEAIILQDLFTTRGRSLIAVTYIWGYDGVPDDVKEAALLAVEAKFRRKGRKSIGGISSRSKKDESESIRDSASSWDKKTGLPIEVVSMLTPYKRFEFPTQPIAQRNL